MKFLQCVVTFVSVAVTATAASIPEAVLEDPNFIPIDEPKKKLKLCESDCDVDSDCVTGLWCADAHKEELRKVGLDDRAANCYSVVKPWNYEVCFDPKILTGGGAGGDPHFRTYDGTKYTYHGECDLVMAHSTLNDENTLDLHARTKIVDNWSLISNAALRIGDDIFEVDNDSFGHYFNGAKDVAFPIVMAGKYTVTSEEKMVDTTNENGETIATKQIAYTIDLVEQGSITITNFMTMLSVRVNSYFADTYGMLGHRTQHGLVGRDGKSVATENEMGAEWQVRDDEAMLFHDISGPQYPETCVLPSASSSVSRRLRDSGFLEQAEKACGNVTENMRQFCVDDVMRTGDVKAAHTYLAEAW